MHIIFGNDVAEQLLEDNKYIVLELDTVRIRPDADPMTAFCVIESIPLTELQQTPAYVNRHGDLMKDYQQRRWSQCLHTIDLLRGHFNGEMDSFYDVLGQRIQQYQHQEPDADWDGVLDVWKRTIPS